MGKLLENQQNLLNRLQAEDFRTYTLMQAGQTTSEQQPVSMSDAAELERLGAQGLGDTVYDDATEPEEITDFLNEFAR